MMASNPGASRGAKPVVIEVGVVNHRGDLVERRITEVVA